MKSNDLQDPVLVVDDEADIRDLMEMTLLKMGLRVDTAVGVEDAKNKLENNAYSLVLTDMRMPDGSGLEVVQHINKLMLDTPVAVITAFGNADQAVEALKSGAFDYLQKPITLSQLRSLVKSAIKVNEPAEAPVKKAAAAEIPQPAPFAPPYAAQTLQPRRTGLQPARYKVAVRLRPYNFRTQRLCRRYRQAYGTVRHFEFFARAFPQRCDTPTGFRHCRNRGSRRRCRYAPPVGHVAANGGGSPLNPPFGRQQRAGLYFRRIGLG